MQQDAVPIDSIPSSTPATAPGSGGWPAAWRWGSLSSRRSSGGAGASPGRPEQRLAPRIFWRSPSSSASSASCRSAAPPPRNSTSASPTSSGATRSGASGSVPQPKPPRSCWPRSIGSGGPVAARQQLIGGVLAQCDLVKFARRQPGPGHAQPLLHQARAFVERTSDPQAVVRESAAVP